MEIRLKEKFLISILLGILGFCFIAQFLRIDFVNELNENRNKTSFPNFKSTSLIEFPRKFDLWFSDNFSLRNTFIYCNNLLDYLLFKHSSNRVIVGKEGRLYLGGKNIEYYVNRKLFTEQELDNFVNTLENNAACFKKQGIEYIFIVTPNSQTIYPEHLPSNIKKIHPYSRLDQLVKLQQKKKSFHLIDFRELLIAKKNEGKGIYYKTDTHWTDIGAYYAYQEIVRNLAEITGNKDDFKPLLLDKIELIKQKKTNGDLVLMLGLKDTITEEEIKLKKKKNSFKEFSFKIASEYDSYTINENIDKKYRALVFRDSFFSTLKPFVSEHFNYVFYVWQHELDYSLVKEIKPKYILHELIERDLQSYKPTPIICD
jgi:hypothetical protein